MQYEVGSIVEGKVTGITKFGAFIELPDKTVGMVHISEVSRTYVNDITEHLKEQQEVKVKVLNISDDGKVSLSIKQALPQTSTNNTKGSDFNRNHHNSQRSNNNFTNKNNSSQNNYNKSSNYNSNRQFNSTTPKGPASFEDMLSKFMSSSEDKIADLKKPVSNRRGGGYNKRKSRDY